MSIHSLMFGWEYPPFHTGGLGVACQGLVSGLLHHGTRITLMLPLGGVEHAGATLRSLQRQARPGMVIRTVRSMLQPYDTVPVYERRISESAQADVIASDLYGPDLGAAVEHYTAQCLEHTQDLTPDVVHCHDWMTFDAGIRTAAHHRVPLIAHIHATELDRTHFRPNAWIADKERRGLLAADRVIAVSHYTKAMLVEHYGIPADRIVVVHNGHDEQGALPDHGMPSSTMPPLVLFLGRLTVQKNPFQFLEIARKVSAHRPDVRFVMAGDGGLMRELVERACRLNMGDRMIFAGNVRKEDAAKLYRSAACFVMPSLSEPFGLVALEAVAHGVPVVLSRQSGAAEVMSAAFTADFWDTDRFADCIVTILREHALASQMRSQAHAILTNLSWRRQAEKVLSLYTNMLQA